MMKELMLTFSSPHSSYHLASLSWVLLFNAHPMAIYLLSMLADWLLGLELGQQVCLLPFMLARMLPEPFEAG
jgi:hypothetical protein